MLVRVVDGVAKPVNRRSGSIPSGANNEVKKDGVKKVEGEESDGSKEAFIITGAALAAGLLLGGVITWMSGGIDTNTPIARPDGGLGDPTNLLNPLNPVSPLYPRPPIIGPYGW
ncbi:MAG: hypothetical protein HY094_05240 [Candidatus Melainabacteria bacterium]|nr:hypothetical protein [Candidatus Melainabacteria bacterium]